MRSSLKRSIYQTKRNGTKLYQTDKLINCISIKLCSMETNASKKYYETHFYSLQKAAFTLIYILTVYTLLVNKVIHKWTFYILKPKFTNSTDFQNT